MRNFNLRTITTSVTLALCVLISCPTETFAQGRGRSRTEQNSNNRGNSRNNNNGNSGRRPNIGSNNSANNNKQNNNRPDNRKPDNNNKNNSHNDRNYNSHNNNNHKQPGMSKPNTPNKPPQGNRNNDRHGYTRPGMPARPNVGHKPQWNGYMAPPARPHRPNYRPMPRFTPPPYWRPHHNAPVIRGILGLTFGTLYNATLDYLYSQNYAIDGYTGDAVYLRNVPQLNYHWEDAILNYTSGRLANAQFIYSTTFYDTGRYNNVYRTLCNSYGSPFSMRTLSGGGYECAWYGGDSQGIVSLEYYRDGGRYYTTLSFGNSY